MTKKLTTFLKIRNKKINGVAERLADYKIDSLPIGFQKAKDRIINWITNFDNANYRDFDKILELLEKMDFITSSEIFEKLAQKSERFLKDQTSYIAPLGEDSESSFRISSFFNQHKRFYSSLSQLLDAIPSSSGNKIILYDDFLNSGGQIGTIFKTLLGLEFEPGEINDEGDRRIALNEAQRKKLLNAEIHLFFYKAFDRGAEYIEIMNKNVLQLKINIHRYSSADATDGVFGDAEDHVKIENGLTGILGRGLYGGKEYRHLSNLYSILKVAGHELLKVNEPQWETGKHESRSLGYGMEARMIVTDFNVPTNTLTAVWLSGKITVKKQVLDWFELLPRRKKVLDNKSKNGFGREALFNQVIHSNDYVYGKDYLEEFHKYTQDQFLKRNLIYDFNNKELGRAYSNVFKEIGTVMDNSEQVKKPEDIFEYLIGLCSIQQHTNPVLVSGLPGSGKTMFLSLFYNLLYDNFRAGAFDKIPIYINLDYFNKIVYNDGGTDFQERAEAEIKNIAIKTRNIAKQFQDKKFLMIIDGIDQFRNPKVNVIEKVYDYINKAFIQSVAGIRRQEDGFSQMGGIYNNLPLKDQPLIKFELAPINNNDAKCDFIIDSFAATRFINDPTTAQRLSKYIKDKIADFKIENFDLLVLETLTYGFKRQINYSKATNFSSFLDIYFNELRINVEKAGMIAHKTFNNQELTSAADKSCTEWWYVQKHPIFKDYFVAKHVVQALLQYEPVHHQTFNFVYPYDLNVFCKEIINGNRVTQKKILDNIKRIIPVLTERSDITAKTHLCYLLGRFKDDNVKEDSKAFLRGLKLRVQQEVERTFDFKGVQKLNRDQKRDLLLLRTIFISLIYLGDSSTSDSYIEQLIENKYFDNLNRGFHLEYYQDLPFDSSPDSLKHEDNYGDYSKTFDKLYYRLLEGVIKGKKYFMFEVELYTLVSLAQHRQVGNQEIHGEEEKRHKIVSLIDQLLNSPINLSQVLLDYIEFIKEKLERTDIITAAHLIRELFEIKKIKRTGWVERNVPDPESVADHIYGAYLLGFYYLPQSLAEHSTYNKDFILKMLLHHDLPEWAKGDINSVVKTSADRMDEEIVSNRMSLLGTYNGVANVSMTKKLYYDFTHGEDINCKIARDLDKLEMLHQLAIYKMDNSLPISENDIFKTKNWLIQRIITDEGKRIKDMILNLF